MQARSAWGSLLPVTDSHAPASSERWKPHFTAFGSGPTVVLIHGSLTTSEQTWQLQRTLAERWELVVVDRRGYEPNPEIERSDFEVDAADLKTFIDSGAHLVGHSYGSLAVLFAAARWPEEVRSLTLIEPPMTSHVRGDPAVEERIRIHSGWLATIHEPEEFYRAFLNRLGVPTDKLPSPLPDHIERQVRLMMHERPPWEAQLPMDRLASAPFPKLVVSGGWDPLFEFTSDALAKQLGTNVKRLVLAGKGHAVQRQGERFNAALEDFLSHAEG